MSKEVVIDWRHISLVNIVIPKRQKLFKSLTKIKDVNLRVTLYKKNKRMKVTKVLRIRALGTLNVCTFHGNPSDISFQSDGNHRATPVAPLHTSVYSDPNYQAMSCA